MNATYDKEADAMYIYLNNKGQYLKSIKINDDFIIDIDKDGNYLGIELLYASKQVCQEIIDQATRIDIGAPLLLEI